MGKISQPAWTDFEKAEIESIQRMVEQREERAYRRGTLDGFTRASAVTVACDTCGGAIPSTEAAEHAKLHGRPVEEYRRCVFDCGRKVYRNDTCFECWSEMHD